MRAVEGLKRSYVEMILRCEVEVKLTGHWIATGQILGKFLWKIDYKNLEIMYPPL